jgi:hypothetical protein
VGRTSSILTTSYRNGDVEREYHATLITRFNGSSDHFIMAVLHFQSLILIMHPPFEAGTSIPQPPKLFVTTRGYVYRALTAGLFISCSREISEAGCNLS